MISQPIKEQNTLYAPRFGESWEGQSLYPLAEWINGMAFRDFNFTPKGRPVIKIAEIKNGISNQTKFTDQQYDDIYLLKKGDMLFCWSGQPETSIDVFWWDGPEGWLNQHIFKVIPKTDNKLFFFYLLKYLRPNFVQIAINKQTTGLGHVTKGDLDRFIVKLPTDKEQRAIAAVLSSLDDKIELLRLQNITLESTAQVIFKEWFVDNIVELMPSKKVLIFEKGIEVGSNNYSKKQKPGYFSFYRVGDITNSGRQSMTFTDSKLLNGKIFEREDVLLSLDGTVGRVFIGGHGGYSSGIRKVFSNKPNLFTKAFIYFWAKSKLAQKTISLYSEGTTITHAGKAIDYLEVPFREDLLKKFNNFSIPIFNKIVNNLTQVQTLSTLRDTLLPKLMKGEVRVKGFSD